MGEPRALSGARSAWPRSGRRPPPASVPAACIASHPPDGSRSIRSTSKATRRDFWSDYLETRPRRSCRYRAEPRLDEFRRLDDLPSRRLGPTNESAIHAEAAASPWFEPRHPATNFYLCFQQLTQGDFTFRTTAQTLLSGASVAIRASRLPLCELCHRQSERLQVSRDRRGPASTASSDITNQSRRDLFRFPVVAAEQEARPVSPPPLRVEHVDNTSLGTVLNAETTAALRTFLASTSAPDDV